MLPFALVLLYTLSAPLLQEVLPVPVPAPLLIAHRGGVVSAGAPECSPAAIRAAAAAGYAMVELDVQSTADDQPFVVHDRALQAAFGVDKSLGDIPAGEAETLRLVANGEPVLRLKDALTLCRELKLGVMLDIKAGGSPAFFGAIRAALVETELEGRALCINRAPGVLEHLAGAVRFRVDDQTPGAAPKGEYWFGLPKDLPPARISALKAGGIPLLPAINRFRYAPETHLHDAWQDIVALAGAGVDGFQIDSVYAHLVPGLDPLETQPNLMPNAGFEEWEAPVEGGVTTTSVGTPPNSLPKHWYGGPGVGATATYSRQSFFEDRPELPGAPKYFFRVAWTVAPSQEWPGETHHVPAFRGTFLEYFGIQDVRALAGKTARLSFYARSSKQGLAIVPILWYSFGATNPADGPKKGRDYELYEASGTRGLVAVAQGAPNPGAPCVLDEQWQYFEKYITLPEVDDKTIAAGHYTGAGFDIVAREAPTVDLALIRLQEAPSR